MKARKWLFAACALSLALPLVASAGQPPRYSEQELNHLWRNVGGKAQKRITSNPEHFWAWSRNEAENYVGPYLGPTGTVMGDPHLKNVFDYRSHGQAALAVDDVDDGGEAPLFLDIVRYVTFLESTDMSTKIHDVFDAYRKGLAGTRVEVPDLMEKAREASLSDIRDRHLSYIKKHLQADDTLDLDELNLKPPSQLRGEKKNEWNTLSEIVSQRTGKTDHFGGGYKSNDSGSSLGMTRYWFLVGDRAPELLVECKELSRPAVSYYQDQADPETRIAQVVAAYSQSGFDPSLFAVLKAGDHAFWMRPRHYQRLDLDDDSVSNGDKKEFAFYLANWLGLSQAKQPGGPALKHLIDKDPAAAKEALENMVRAYEREISAK